MKSPLRYLSSILFSLSLTASAQTFVEGDYQLNRKKATSGFEVAELLAGSNITITWDNTAKTATIASSASGTWGSITGTLSNQTDLQTALNAKLATATAAATYAPLASPTFTGTLNVTDAVRLGVDGANNGRIGLYDPNDAQYHYLSIETGEFTFSDSVVATSFVGTWSGNNIAPSYLGTGTGITTKYLRGDGTWQTISSGGITDGDTLTTGLTFPSNGLKVLDNGSDSTLSIAVGEDLSVNETLTVLVNDASRIVTFAGDLNVSSAATVSGTNTGDITLAGTPDYLTLTNQVLTRNAVDLATDVTGVTPVANGGTGAATLTANNVLLGNGTSALQTVAPGTTGNVLTSNGTTWTSTAAAATNPAGSGSELQFRSSGTAFGAVTNSSVSGGTLTLGNAEALATTPTAYLTLRNTTAAAAGAQQVSPSIVLEGQGWKTTATAASQTVRFRENVLPIQGTTNPSATWQLQSEINNSGTWDNRITVTTENGVVAIPGTAWIGGVVGSSGASDKMQIAGNLTIRTTAAGVPVFRAVPSGSDIYLDANSGNMYIRINGTTQALEISSARVQIGANTAVNSATATAQTIKGPNATGTTATGGSLIIAGGTGTTAGGAVILATSASTGAPVAAVTVNNNAVTTFAKPPVMPVYTVATLPATAANGMVQGAHAVVTDATTPTYLGALTGGGAVVCPVFYNGTAWVSH